MGIVNDYRIVTVGRNKLHPALYTVSGFHCLCAVIKAYSQSQTDSNGVKCVIHRKFSRYGKAHIGALSVAGCRKAHALCGKLYILRYKRCLFSVGRISEQSAWGVLHHVVRPFIVNVYAADTAGGEQQRLCGGILLHSVVKIKMILRKIRKRTDRKINAGNAAEYKRMR